MQKTQFHRQIEIKNIKIEAMESWFPKKKMMWQGLKIFELEAFNFENRQSLHLLNEKAPRTSILDPDPTHAV